MKILLLITTIGFFIASCKKNDNPINIKLKNKPLSVIKETIQGKWQLHYAYGGWTGHNRVDYMNTFIKFKNNHIQYSHNSEVFADTIIYWKKVDDIFSQQRDSIYIITFRDTLGYPYSWVVEGIYRDTLLLVDYGPDPMGYHLTKKN